MTRNGYQITNAAGNIVDLDGNEIDGAFLTNYPGFPGFGSINAAQAWPTWPTCSSPACQVVYGYIADLHGNEDIPASVERVRQCARRPGERQPLLHRPGRSTTTLPSGSSSSGWPRTASRQEHLFVFSSDEGDHEAGANVGRAQQPTPDRL